MEAASQLMGRFVQYIINPAILLVFAAGFCVFMYGLVEFIWGLNKGEASNEGKNHMLWGMIGMFIMVAALTIIKMISNSIGADSLLPRGY